MGEDVSRKNQSLFRLIPADRFSRKHLEEWPVWSEYYSYDEREDIVAWGIDEDWLKREIETKRNGSNHAMYPLLQTDPFPDRMRIYIKARFETPSGNKLSGYIINEDAYAIGIFSGDQEFVFNQQLPGRDVHLQCEALRHLLEDPNDFIIPFKYETDFTDQHGRRIEGTFRFATDTT